MSKGSRWTGREEAVEKERGRWNVVELHLPIRWVAGYLFMSER